MIRMETAWLLLLCVWGAWGQGVKVMTSDGVAIWIPGVPSTEAPLPVTSEPPYMQYPPSTATLATGDVRRGTVVPGFPTTTTDPPTSASPGNGSRCLNGSTEPGCNAPEVAPAVSEASTTTASTTTTARTTTASRRRSRGRTRGRTQTNSRTRTNTRSRSRSRSRMRRQQDATTSDLPPTTSEMLTSDPSTTPLRTTGVPVTATPGPVNWDQLWVSMLSSPRAVSQGLASLRGILLKLLPP